ncbi:MAG: hypothetical protein MR766_06560 [Erysipelotrichaceae bacterium]|nr:hypothetical protein [Erysipelotrichaceae bacterium]
MEKSNLSDDELIELIKQNDNEAFNMLLFRYRNLITIVCFSYVKSAKMCGIDITELKSIACICIYKNLKYYVKEKSSIKTFLNMVINQGLTKFVSEAIEHYRLLETYINLDENVFEDSSLKYEEVIPDHDTSITNWIDNNERFDSFNEIDEEYLSKKEKMVLLLKAVGYTYAEIADKLNIAITQPDVSIKKIKKIK